jgi:hypothetical protein
VCANAFADTNGNGQQDADEGYMAGVTFTLAQDNAVKAQGISTGTSIPICFEETAAGGYIVAQVLPRNLEPTTAPAAAIDVTEGATISLAFGSRLKSDLGEGDGSGNPTPTVAGQVPGDPGSGGGGLTTLAIVGLVAIFLAIVLLGVLIFLIVRQQRS